MRSFSDLGGRWIALLLVALLPIASLGQAPLAARSPDVSPDGIWTAVDQIPAGHQMLPAGVRPSVFRAFGLNEAALTAVLKRTPMEFTAAGRQAPELIHLPMPDGSYARFHIVESPVMEPGLAAKFPEIKTYLGQGLDDPHASARLDWTPAGFHAQVLSPRGAVYLDPYSRGDRSLYSCYYKRDYRRLVDDFVCLVPGQDTNLERTLDRLDLLRSGPTLRTYRLANAATGEYTQYHGGTVAAGLAAIVTAINRVTGIYEKEVCIRLVLVANNDLIVYTNSSTDPYTNNNGSTMLNQNQTTLDSVIGSANYDIGHVFSTGGGGVAQLGSVCVAGAKARGVTGSPDPSGDAFWVDYVAHEMGHQFGANHTFNSTTGNCGGGNRNTSTAYEPGSGSTLMAYAGICGADNLQLNSDAYFHSISFDEILSYITSGSGNGCAAQSSTINTAPAVSAGPNYTIPRGTPFLLTATGSDVDGDPLTYCWEERDLGPAQTLTAADNGSSPLFRSFPPTTNTSRTFPRMAFLLGTSTSLGEKLPTTARAMNFRVTARDNRAGGGGVNTADMQVNVVTSAGPFTVTAPNTGVIWSGLQTVAWNVAHTTGTPVNAAHVNIRLSLDGGSTYPLMLVSNTPNDGSQAVVLPNLASSTARIKVEANAHIFFDISDTNFTITFSSPTPLVSVESMALAGENCSPANGAADPGEQVVVEVALKNSGTGNTTNLVATLLPGDGVLLPGPAQNFGALTAGVAAVSRPFTFTADGTCGGDISLRFQLQDGATDGGVLTNALALGVPVARSTSASNTALISVPASGTSGSASPYPATLSVNGATGLISKVAVTLNKMYHTFPDDLDILLVGPGGQSVILMSDAGDGGDIVGVTLTFDDDAAAALPDASQITSGTYKPTNYGSGDTFASPAPAGPYGSALSVFQGSQPNGTWSLYVVDDATTDRGAISNGWQLVVQTLAPSCCVSAASADLTLLKTGAPDPVPLGSNLTYTLWVTNRGPDLAVSVTVTDTLPAGVSMVSAVPSQGTCTNEDGVVSCQLGSLADQAGASITLQVIPAVSGFITNRAVVATATADPDLTNNVSVAASTVLAPPQLTVDPVSLAFGAVPVGSGSSRVFRVSNAGGQALSGSAAGAGPFAVFAGSPFNLAPAATGEVTITFQPPAEGAFSNEVVFSSNGGNSTNPVTGEGAVAPDAQFVAHPTNGLAPLLVEFTDESTGTITSRFWTFGDGDTAHATLTNFTHPYALPGTYTVSLAISGPLGGSTNSKAAYITVTQLPPLLQVTPAGLDFGLVATGQAQVLPFTVVNLGQELLTGFATVGGPFAVDGGSPFNIPGGQTGIVTVSFAPPTPDAFSNDVVFTSNGGGAIHPVLGWGLIPAQMQVGPAHHDFGVVATGTTAQFAFSVTNIGGTLLTGTAAVGGPFTVISGAAFDIPAFGSTGVVISFMPAVAGAFSNDVVFQSDGGQSVNPVLGMGAVVPAAEFSGSPTTGLAPLLVSFTDDSTGTITGRFWDFGDGFTTLTELTALDHTFELAGTYTVSLVVSGPLGASTNTRAAYIVATNLPPHLQVTPASHDYGIAAVGNVDPFSFTVSNLGGDPLTGAAAVGGPFAVVSGSPFELAGGSSTGVVVEFQPPDEGAYSNDVVFASNGGAATRPVIGEGAVAPLAQFTAIPVSGLAPLPVTFDDSSLGTVTNRAWDFGDGFTTNTLDKIFIHTYASTGRFTVSLTVSGPLGTDTRTEPDYIIVTNNPLADLSLRKSGAPDPLVAENQLTYWLTVSNAGPDEASEVVVTDVLPAGVLPAGPVVTNLGVLAAGAETTLVLVVTVEDHTVGVLTNAAAVSSAADDPDMDNNSALAITAVTDTDGDGLADFADPDDDNDGIPDAFEILYGLDPLDPGDAGVDSDLDGFSNAEEYLADTHPGDSNSFHRVVAISNALPLTVYFPSSTARVYGLQSTTNLRFDAWQPLGSNWPGSGGVLGIPDTNGAPDRQYRIGVEWPPVP